MSTATESSASARDEAMGGVKETALAALYVPRILQQHLVDHAGERHWASEGTAAFCDVSGFTKLSERLARKGREGAEQIAEAIGSIFESILAVAYEQGGSLLKFGGDALLLWFEGPGHASRAARATILMRRMLRTVGRIEVPGARITLRMSQAVHSGSFDFFAVGETHCELLPTGPAWTQLVLLEHAASAGEIVISPQMAAQLPAGCAGGAKGAGIFLRREPPGSRKVPLAARPDMPAEQLAHCLSPAVRAHVMAGSGASEHRPVTMAFIRFDGTDALIAQAGPDAAADALHRLVCAVDAATEGQGVALLASDLDANGGKLILTAGAPTITGDDEERMLLALRQLVSKPLPISIRIGVNRGSVFAGDVGPAYRRTYTVMGDAVNLAARVMAKAVPGTIYATSGVLERSSTQFATTALEPFLVKGKAQPVQAWEVGPATGSRTRQVELERLPLVGRDDEHRQMLEGLAEAKAGRGRLFEIVGEPGVGKTRLVEALREAAGEFRHLHAVCEAYTTSTPYVLWRELLREMLALGRDADESALADRLRALVAQTVPAQMPWLSLIAAAFAVEVPASPEVEMLAEKNRRGKLHEATSAFLAAVVHMPVFVEIEDAHHMDEASAALLAHLALELAGRPWLVAVARRSTESGFVARPAPTIVQIPLEPLATPDALRIAKAATEQHPLPPHVLDLVATRSGGNPQFLRDLVRSAIESGGTGGLPESAEAATMARIDALPPADRALIRRASLFGLTFHPRMLGWLADGDGEDAAGPAAFERLRDFFETEADGYLRFRRSLLRDAAYEGLPYKLRRRLHGAIAARLEGELADPGDSAGILSLHYFVAGAYSSAWRYATIAARRALGVYAYVEAAELFARAIDAGRRLPDVAPRDLAEAHEMLGDAWNRAGEFRKASDAYAAAQRLLVEDPRGEAGLLLKRSRLEEKLGRYPQALRWAARARGAVEGHDDPDSRKRIAQSSAWYATVLQAKGNSVAAVRWAQKAIVEAEAADEPDALGAACFVIGWAHAALGKADWEPYIKRSLDAYQRSGDRIKQAVILSNVGVVCQGEGRWDEAMSYYERGRVECQKIGDTINAALARVNMAEILIDRGELAEAEATLRDVLPMWRAAKYRYVLGCCLALLGRTLLRSGRLDEATQRFDEAKEHFVYVGAEQEALAVDARLAECHVYAGRTESALELANATLARAEKAKGVAMVTPLLARVRGFALMQQGDPEGAFKAFVTSIGAARARRDLFEVLLTLLAMCELDRVDGVPSASEVVTERDALLSSLKIRTPPSQPPLRR